MKNTPLIRVWPTRIAASLTAAVASFLFTTDTVQADIFSTDNFSLYGDFRARAEGDFNSQTSAGVKRDGRTRVRVRARVGFNYDATDYLRFGMRLRTGSDDSHQSPHITVLDFDGNNTGDAHVNLDKWFVQVQKSSFKGWIGRNSLNFWKQNEMFWDDDVTPMGVGVSWNNNIGSSTLTLNAGHYSLPVGMQQFSGKLNSVQAVFAANAGKARITGAFGVLHFDANKSDPDGASLLRGNGMRNYNVIVSSLQAKIPAGDTSVTLGADYYHNTTKYDPLDDDANTANNFNQKDGYVLSASYGGTSKKGDWLAAYYYSRIEALAVNSSYAQDDWVRWGSATETRGTDMKGHELRLGYAITDQLKAIFRIYLVDSITTIEDGNRARLDFNFSF